MIVFSKKHQAFIVRIPGSGLRDEVATCREDADRLERWHKYAERLRNEPGFREADERSFENNYIYSVMSSA